jgi:hypothetical protein
MEYELSDIPLRAHLFVRWGGDLLMGHILVLHKEELDSYCRKTRRIYEQYYAPEANLKSLTSIYKYSHLYTDI